MVRPYLSIRNATKQTGEIYFEITSDSSVAEIQRYNDQLDQWERKQGYQIKLSGGFSCIESYEQTTLFILRKLLDFSSSGSKGQREYNQKFLKESSLDFADDLKSKRSEMFLSIHAFSWFMERQERENHANQLYLQFDGKSA